MIKQANLFQGADLTPTEKYNLEIEKSNEVLDFMIGRGMKIIEEPKPNKKNKKLELKECFYFRDSQSIYKINYCVRRLVFCKDLISLQDRAIDQTKVLDCGETIGQLLRPNDILYIKLENGVVRRFVFMKAYKWKFNCNMIQAYDIEDGEVLVFNEKQIYKVIELGKDD